MLPRPYACLLALAPVALFLVAQSTARETRPLVMPATRELAVPFERIDEPTISADGRTIAISVVDEDDRRHIYLIPADGGEPVQATKGLADDRAPKLSTDGKMLAFVSDRSGNADIWVAPVAGGPARQITDDPADDLDPEWSPDGTRLVFASNRSGSMLLYVVPAAGGQVFPVSAGAGPDRHPAWSPDRESIAFESTRDGRAGIWVQPSSGGEAVLVSPPQEPAWAPSWSSDSRRVRAFGGPGSALVMFDYAVGDPTASRFTPLRLKADPSIRRPALSRAADRVVLVKPAEAGIGVMNYKKGGDVNSVVESADVYRAPAWAPDGRRVTFVSDKDARRDLFIVGVSTGRMARLAETTGRDADPDWSSAGDVVFSLESAAGSSLWVLEPKMGKRIQIVGPPGRHRHPVWSPNDKLVAFTSDREGSDDIWVAQVGDGKMRRVTSQPGAETQPSWSPDGKWIVFVSDQGGSRGIWKVATEGGQSPEPLSLPRKEECTDFADPDWNSSIPWIAVTCLSGGPARIYLVSPDSGKAVSYYQRQEMSVSEPAWSHDGTHLAYAWSRPDKILVLDLPGE